MYELEQSLTCTLGAADEASASHYASPEVYVDSETGHDYRGSMDPTTTKEWMGYALSIQSSCLPRTNINIRDNGRLSQSPNSWWFFEPFQEFSAANTSTQWNFVQLLQSEEQVVAQNMMTELESLLGEWHATKDTIDEMPELNVDPGLSAFPAMLDYIYGAPMSVKENESRVSGLHSKEAFHDVNWSESDITQISGGDSLFGYAELPPTFNGRHGEEAWVLPLPDIATMTPAKSDVSQSSRRKRKATADDDGRDDDSERFQAPKEDSSRMMPFRDDRGKWRTPCSCPDKTWGRIQDAERHLRQDAPHVAKRRCRFGCGRVFKSARESVMKKHLAKCPAFLRRKGMEDVLPDHSRRKHNSEESEGSSCQLQD